MATFLLVKNSIYSTPFVYHTGLGNLDSLVLSHNHLRIIPARAFTHLNRLNSLELDGNGITKLDAECFAGLEGKLLPTIDLHTLSG